MVPDRQKVWTDGPTDGMDGRMDGRTYGRTYGRRQNYSIYLRLRRRIKSVVLHDFFRLCLLGFRLFARVINSFRFSPGVFRLFAWRYFVFSSLRRNPLFRGE